MSLHLFAPCFSEELTGKNGPVYEKQPIIGKQDAHPGCTALNRGYVDKDPSVRVSELSMDGSVWDFFFHLRKAVSFDDSLDTFQRAEKIKHHRGFG
jgi:hypothetical protein